MHTAITELARCVDELAELGIESQETLAELRDRLAERRFDIVVAGQFKRGKTSLINALVGMDLLPVAVIPLTSIVTVLSHGPRVEATIVHESGEERVIALAELPAYVTERGNPGNGKHVREAHVTCPSRWLEGGIRIVDTPGVGSVYRNNTEVALQYLPKADAVLFVLSVDQPLSVAECEFLADVRQYAERIFFVLNKADLLSAQELEESLHFTRDTLAAALGSEPRLYALSARFALRARMEGPQASLTDGGMAAFGAALEAFLAHDKAEVLASSVARKLLRSTSHARFAAELELQALSAPLAELTRKAARFGEKKQEILAARDELAVLLGGEAARTLLRPLEEGLGRFKEELKAEVVATVERRFADASALPLRELARLLEREAISAIREGYDGWQEREAEAMDRTFEAFCVRYAHRVDAIVDDLYRFAADLFAVPYGALSAPEFRGTQSRFYYKFWNEPPALRTLGSALLFALPRALAARRVLEGARCYAIELVETQSGRLRYDFSQRIERALMAFRGALNERIETAIAAIDTAVDKALALRQAGEGGTGSRHATLESTLERLTRLARRIEGSTQTSTAESATAHPAVAGAPHVASG